MPRRGRDTCRTNDTPPVYVYLCDYGVIVLGKTRHFILQRYSIVTCVSHLTTDHAPPLNQDVESGQTTRVQDAPSSSSASEAAPDSVSTRQDSKRTGVVVAWFLFAIELGVAYYLFRKGDGRVSGLTDDGVCVDGVGPQRVSVIAFVRGGLAVGAQLLLWVTGKGVGLPDRAFPKIVVISVRPLFQKPDLSSVACRCVFMGVFVASVVSAVSALMMYTLWPIVVACQALCAIKKAVGVYVVCGMIQFVAICGTLEPAMTIVDTNDIDNLLGVVLCKFDNLFSVMFNMPANMTQSGVLAGLVFAGLPTFELTYFFATCCWWPL